MPEPLPPPLTFDRVADEYEATRYLPDPVAEAVALIVTTGASVGGWILDAGVGTGRLGRALARRHGRTVGVDVSRPMMDWMNREAGPRPHLALADLRALPFPGGHFQAVLAVHVFHLIAEWEQALAETWRVLAPGGRLFVGAEDRDRTAVREFYLRRAEAEGLLAPQRGPHSAEIVTRLRRWGAEIEEIRPPALRWDRKVPLRDTLAMLERRTYTALWEVAEEPHRRLIGETRAWLTANFPSLDVAERLTTQLTLYAARKPIKP